jgi:cyanophycinase-like exopeptidase
VDGTVTLIGSGEMTPSMGKVHRTVLSKISGPAKAVFLDTPAGFELNADHISAKAVEYFKRRLQVDLEVVSFKSSSAATSAEVVGAVQRLQNANYVFAGPGSPTYAVRNWRDTAVWAQLVQRVSRGAHLVMASAAAIALGSYALPVYEIYKVGEPPRWVDGLGLLTPYGLELAIVPHWNNDEGGTHDTRYCFVGERRLRLLEQLLPNSAVILGIDEYTACFLDLSGGGGQVMGAGQVTVRHKGRDLVFPAGSVFELHQLKGIDSWQAQAGVLPGGWSGEQQTKAEWAPPSSAEETGPDLQEDPQAEANPYIDLLVSLRAQLRADRQWALADEIRDQLAALGITLEDGPTETTWRRH